MDLSTRGHQRKHSQARCTGQNGGSLHTVYSFTCDVTKIIEAMGVQYRQYMALAAPLRPVWIWPLLQNEKLRQAGKLPKVPFGESGEKEARSTPLYMQSLGPSGGHFLG